MISILILTHNRPALFERCLKSVLDQAPADVEIMVNNDSNDIAEIADPRVQYFYNKFENLSLVYKFLLDQATKDYVYFLEDDDYLTPGFFKQTLDADLIAGNYFPVFNHGHLHYSHIYNNHVISPVDFLLQLNHEALQLGQHIFKKDCIANFEFPMDSNIHNDIKIVTYAATNAQQVRTTRKIFYCQTADGKDNISFPDTKITVNIE